MSTNAQHAASAVDITTVKAGVAWGGYGLGAALNWLGFTSWGEFAGFCASIYSLILIGEWAYKKWKGRRHVAADDSK